MVSTLTDSSGKAAWTIKRLFDFEGFEKILAFSETTVWEQGIVYKAAGADGRQARVASVAGINLADGSITARKEPIAEDLTPYAENQAPDEMTNGVADKKGDLIYAWLAPSPSNKSDYKPKMTKLSAKDGSVLWTKALDTTAVKNPGDKPLIRLGPDGNLLFLWQEPSIKDAKFGQNSTLSIAKFATATGDPIWHQRVFANLGGTYSSSNWQTDDSGNIFIIFNSLMDEGGPGRTSAPVSAMKISGANGAVEWLRAFPAP